MNTIDQTRYDMALLPATSLAERAAVVALVLLAHGALAMAWMLQPAAPAVMVNEMSVSFANVQMQQADVTPRPKNKPREAEPTPQAEPTPREAEPVPSEAPAQKAEAQPAPPAATPPSPVVLDAQPDYRADYLNNPRPPYPMVARRMGYHGKVILNVEVLAEGKAGQVLLYQSCGHEILDNAALQTVKGWRFTPARHFGQPVTQWFLVPIKFSLEDSAA